MKNQKSYVSVPIEEYEELYRNPNTIELDNDGNILLGINGKIFKKEDFLNNPQGTNGGRFVCDSKTAYRIVLNNTGLSLCHRIIDTKYGNLSNQMYIYGQDALSSVIKKQEETIKKYEKNWFVRLFLKKIEV